MRSASLVLSDDQVTELQAIVARHTSPQRMVMRARTVLLVAAGSPLRSTARMFECRPATVRKWCRRFHASGLAGLADACRPGRPRQITAMERCSVIATACGTPQNYGLEGYSVWSGAVLARVLTASGRVAQISERSVQRVLKRASLKPHRCAYWKRRTDPDFDVKMRPVVQLYVNPPTDGPVVCADEKTCIQALERRFPDLPVRRPGELSRREVEYKRHGTRCLTAGFFVHTGKIIGMLTPTRPKPVFLAFLDLLNEEVPKGQVIHLVLDNLNTHKGAHIRAWQDAHPGRLVIYYLPFHASWLRIKSNSGSTPSSVAVYAAVTSLPPTSWRRK